MLHAQQSEDTDSATKRGLLVSSGATAKLKVLGCTAPVVPPETDAIVFVADGRFHLEAIMIANPAIPAFRCASIPM